MNQQRNPLVRSLTFCAVVVALGILAIVLGKRVVARTEVVGDQMPGLISGGIGGMALVVIGCVFAYIQVSRICNERERLLQSGVLDDVAATTDARKARLAAAHRAPRHELIPGDVVTELAAELAEDETTAIPVVPRQAAKQRRTRAAAGATTATRSTATTRPAARRTPKKDAP